MNGIPDFRESGSYSVTTHPTPLSLSISLLLSHHIIYHIYHLSLFYFFFSPSVHTCTKHFPSVKGGFVVVERFYANFSCFCENFRWSAIAARLPGRTDNEIKNYWNTHIRKRLLRMGIDPVTHAPRLDLLDMSSILRSALGNPSLLNLPGLLGAQALVNPELLKLAATATLLSLKNNNDQNTNCLQVSQNLQQTNNASNPNYANCQVQSQVAPPDQFMCQFQTPTSQSHNVNNNNNNIGLSGNLVNMSCSSSTSPENSIPSNYLGEDLISHQQYQLDNFLNMGYESVLSTPLSTPTPLDSSTTNVNNNSTEEERDTYCSDVFKFEIPENLDINDFL